eukprot:scaffold382_cov380-Prasinococcus_capsulatus_cf.AAC.5
MDTCISLQSSGHAIRSPEGIRPYLTRSAGRLDPRAPRPPGPRATGSTRRTIAPLPLHRARAPSSTTILWAQHPISPEVSSETACCVTPRRTPWHAREPTLDLDAVEWRNNGFRQGAGQCPRQELVLHCRLFWRPDTTSTVSVVQAHRLRGALGLGACVLPSLQLIDLHRLHGYRPRSIRWSYPWGCAAGTNAATVDTGASVRMWRPGEAARVSSSTSKVAQGADESPAPESYGSCGRVALSLLTPRWTYAVALVQGALARSAGSGPRALHLEARATE